MEHLHVSTVWSGASRLTRSLRTRRVVAVLGAVAAIALSTPSAHAAVTTALIQGDGSSWAANPLQAWINDTSQQGLQVVYTSTGSAQGRLDFAEYTNDFALSDIGYQGRNPQTSVNDTSSRPYAYLPLVAGGTSLPYQLVVGGKRVSNLRLAGLTIAKIFTNQITNWDDPQITADNNGQQLPPLPIIPVVHSEAAGSTAQLTQWLATQYPQQWTPFNGGSDTSDIYFPRQGAQVSQDGSDGVINFISSRAGNGTIGYDEYRYALGKAYPVAKVGNAAGYFTLPTQYNVAVALTQAVIDTNPSSPGYGLQDLTSVYTYNDPRTYPLSSYSYGIIPTSPTDFTMTTAKRQALADFLEYSVCQGQGEIGPLGFAPLPANLVQAALGQVQLLHQADPSVDVSNDTLQQCHNPTFDPNNPDSNHLAAIAPLPATCDALGAGPCGTAGAPVVSAMLPEFPSVAAAGLAATAIGSAALAIRRIRARRLFQAATGGGDRRSRH